MLHEKFIEFCRESGVKDIEDGRLVEILNEELVWRGIGGRTQGVIAAAQRITHRTLRESEERRLRGMAG